MQELFVAWNAIKFGGAMVYPLLALGVLAIAIIIDRAVLYARCLRLPVAGVGLVKTRVVLINATDNINELRNGTGIGIFEPGYGPRRTVYGGVTVPLPSLRSSSGTH
jgi:hypothetical protein